MLLGRKIFRYAFTGFIIIGLSVPAFAKDSGTYSVGCLASDTAMATAEGLVSGDPATVTVSPASLWPPNHKFRDISLVMTPTAVPAIIPWGPFDVSLTVNSITDDQVADDDAGGFGCGRPTSAQGADWAPTDFSTLVQAGVFSGAADQVVMPGVELRGERCAKDGTRTYSIEVTCCDTTNNICDSTPEILSVTVAKSQGKSGK